MAARAQLIANTDIVDDCSKVTTPTLVVTGERSMDRVVPVDGTLAYLPLIAGAAPPNARANRTSRIDHDAGRVRGAGSRVR